MLGICTISKNHTECGPTKAIIHSSPVFSSNNAKAKEFSTVVSDVQTKINPPLIAVAGALFLAAVVARLSLTHTVKSDADNRVRRIIVTYRLYIGLVTLSALLFFGEAIACTEMVSGAKYVLKQDAEISKFDINEGSPLISLQWATFAVKAIFSIVTTANVLKEYGNYD